MTAATLTLSDPSQMLAMVPYLLGFYPTESVVLIVTSDSHVVVTARFDLDFADHPDQLGRQLRGILTEDVEVICIAYASSREDAEIATDGLAILLGDAIAVSMDVWMNRYAYSGCGCERCVSGMSLTDLPDFAERASELGLTALESRSALKDAIAPPTGRALLRARQLWISADQEVRAQADAEAYAQRIVRSLVGSPADEYSLITLGVLIHQISVRDSLWVAMTPKTAQDAFELWSAVVRAVPEERSIPALCLTSMAAWLMGNGAMQVTCFTRAAELDDDDYSMIRLLELINLAAIPPDQWGAIIDEYRRA